MIHHWFTTATRSNIWRHQAQVKCVGNGAIPQACFETQSNLMTQHVAKTRKSQNTPTEYFPFWQQRRTRCHKPLPALHSCIKQIPRQPCILDAISHWYTHTGSAISLPGQFFSSIWKGWKSNASCFTQKHGRNDEATASYIICPFRCIQDDIFFKRNHRHSPGAGPTWIKKTPLGIVGTLLFRTGVQIVQVLVFFAIAVKICSPSTAIQHFGARHQNARQTASTHYNHNQKHQCWSWQVSYE